MKTIVTYNIEISKTTVFKNFISDKAEIIVGRIHLLFNSEFIEENQNFQIKDQLLNEN